MRTTAEPQGINFDSIYPFILTDSRFFESLDRYSSDVMFDSLVRDKLPLDWVLRRNGIWFIASPPLHRSPIQGWKIHLSATSTNADSCIREVADYCIAETIPFKFLIDKYVVDCVNSKAWSRTASGKVIAIYPTDAEEAMKCMINLKERIRTDAGPYILSDKRFGKEGNVFYRYGGFEAITRVLSTGATQFCLISPDGKYVEDEREPFWSPPAWIHSDPFRLDNEETEEPSSDSDDLLGNGKYEVDSVLQFSNSGGVYRGSEVSSGLPVVIKEARPHTTSGKQGYDAISVRRHEYEMLIAANETRFTPQPLDFFFDWEHAFLVEEYIPGQTLWSWCASNSAYIDPLASTDDYKGYWRKVVDICIQISVGVHELHKIGMIIGDISANNFLLHGETNTVRLIDLESASTQAKKAPVDYRTPGYLDISDEPSVERDTAALATLFAGLFFPVGQLNVFSPAADVRFLEAHLGSSEIEVSFIELIKKMKEPRSSQIALPCVITELRRLRETLAGCDIRYNDVRDDRSHDDGSLIRKIASFTLHNIVNSDEGPFFPSSPFSRSATGYAHGAAGVIRFLNIAKCDIPEEVWERVKSLSLLGQRLPGLYAGRLGVSWVALELGDSDFASKVHAKAEEDPRLYALSDIYSGVAGLGLSCLHFWKTTNDSTFLDKALRCGSILKNRAVHVGEAAHWYDDEGKIWLGYPHGASGVAHFLLLLGLSVDDEEWIELGRQGLFFDLSHKLRVPNKRLTSFPKEIGSTSFHPYLYSGTAGVLATAIRYAAHLPDNEALNQHLQDLLPDLFRYYTVAPGFQHGLAGIVNTLLDCRDLLPHLDVQQHLHNAMKGLKLYLVPLDNGIGVPGDGLLRLSTDISTGGAGVGMVLARYLYGTRNPLFTLDSFIRPPL